MAWFILSLSANSATEVNRPLSSNGLHHIARVSAFASVLPTQALGGARAAPSGAMTTFRPAAPANPPLGTATTTSPKARTRHPRAK